MAIDLNENVSLLDQVKIQAQVLLPLLKKLRPELGEARANAIVRNALREWSRELRLEVGTKMSGGPREKWAAMQAAALPRIGDAVDVALIKQHEGALESNVTGCRYADFFRRLGEPELGFLLLCETDLHVAEVGRPEVELRRTQTIMEGAPYCDFRYRMRESAERGGE